MKQCTRFQRLQAKDPWISQSGKTGHDQITDKWLHRTHRITKIFSEIWYNISVASIQRPLGIFLMKNRTCLDQRQQIKYTKKTVKT